MNASMLLLLFFFQASKPITLLWDAVPTDQGITEIRIYDIGMVPETLLGTAPCTPTCPTSVTFSAPRKAYSFTARAYAGLFESDNSNVVVAPLPPPIKNLRKP